MSVVQDLQLLYDEVAEFHDCCTLLCDQLASATAEDSGVDANALPALKSLSEWMKERMGTVRQELKRIQEKARIQT